MKTAALSFFTALLSVALWRSAPAQTKDDADARPVPASQASDWQWSFSIRNRTGLKLDEPRVLQMSRTIFDAKGVYKISDDWRLTLEARAHIDPVERLGYPKSLWIDPRQVLLDGKAGKVDMKLGLQQIVWGQSDGLRVLDVVNPLDYREFILEDFIDSRRPLWMARADIPVKTGSIQLLWVPYFAPARLPGAENEFGAGPSFGLGLINEAAGNSITPQFAIEVEPAKRPAYRLDSSQFGARYSRSIGAWDLTANYFYGWEEIPTNYLKSVELREGGAYSALVIAPKFDRKMVLGGTAATNFGPAVLRIEAGWNHAKPAALKSGGFEKSGQFSGVVGLDYSAGTWLWISGQYFLQFASAPGDGLLFPRYNHLSSIYFRTNFLRDTLRPELFILAGLNQKQYLVRPRVIKTIGDHFSIGLGADFLGGERTNIFGYFDSRDRAVVELKWMW